MKGYGYCRLYREFGDEQPTIFSCGRSFSSASLSSSRCQPKTPSISSSGIEASEDRVIGQQSSDFYRSNIAPLTTFSLLQQLTYPRLLHLVRITHLIRLQPVIRRFLIIIRSRSSIPSNAEALIRVDSLGATPRFPLYASDDGVLFTMRFASVVGV